MNDSETLDSTGPLHKAYLCLGSNIQPEENICRAAALLRRMTTVLAFSTCWETPAVGSDGEHAAAPRFLNAAACIATTLEPAEVKAEVIAPLEQALGRMRGPDKFAPRTIDLDITLYDARVLDEALWERAYLALIFAELLPTLRSPRTGESLSQIAERWRRTGMAVPRPDIQLGGYICP